MWGRSLRLGNLGRRVGRRTFLSSKYGCEEAWGLSKRGEERSVKVENPEELYSRLESRANRQEAISLVDVDLFVQCAKTDHLAEVRDLLHKSRCSAHAHLALPSTNYSAIRLFDEADALDDLVQMLDDRLNYGLFLDRFTANMLFDKLLKRQHYLLASKLAGFLMLQEDFQGPITEQFALYSAYKFLQLPLPPKQSKETVDEASKTPVKKKKVEQIKIRVAYLRNPFFDDHFDLTDDRIIAGKTLAMITSKRDDSTSHDCNLLGWVFYKKFDKAVNTAQKLVKKGKVYKETLDRLEHVLENNDDKDEQNAKMLGDIISMLKSIPTVETNMEDEIVKILKSNIEQHEQNEIVEHVEMLKSWETIRSAKLQEQIERLEILKKEGKIAHRQKLIQEIDEKLSFFDNEEQIDLKIYNRKQENEKESKYKNKKVVKSDVNYIPPEVSA